MKKRFENTNLETKRIGEILDKIEELNLLKDIDENDNEIEALMASSQKLYEQISENIFR